MLSDKTLGRFVFVGVVNTLVGTAIMFVFYNVFHFSYWVSSASNYFFGSLLSYILNKRYTFQNNERGWKPAIRFTVSIISCYLLAYGMAKPLMAWLLTSYDKTIQENVSMLFGMGLFVVLNYLSQRFFAFKKAGV